MTAMLKFKNPAQLLIITLSSLLMLWIVSNIIYGERVLAGDGLGWDGVSYTYYAKNFYQLIINHQFSYYRAQRIFPSFLVYLTSKLFHFPITAENSPILFSILNTSMLFLSLIVWRKLAKKMRWGLGVQIISFCGLFLNYANLKMSVYYPTLTDTTAFTIGLLILYLYLTESKALLLLTTIIGAFTFPTLLYVGLILYLFPVNSRIEVSENKSDKLNILIAFIQASLITFICALIWQPAVAGIYTQPLLKWSYLALFTYLAMSTAPLSLYYSGLLAQLKNLINIKRVIVAILVLSMVKLLVHLISSPNISSISSPWEYIVHLAGQALSYPFNFIISHVIYYGPIVCLLVFFWKASIKHLMTSKATGLYILAGIYGLLSIGSESRQLINFLPVAVYMVSEILNKKEVPAYFVCIFVMLSLFMSKFWLPLNHGRQWPSLLTNPPELTMQFPLQWYFMSQGPWVSPKMYIINALLVFGAFFVVFVLIKKTWSKTLWQTRAFGNEQLI